MSSSPRQTPHARSHVRAVLTALAALAVLALAGPAAASAKKPPEPQVYIVSHGSPPSNIPPNVHYTNTIQGAVDQTVAGDWVLIEPGTYYEEVTVTSAHSGIWIRGMDRNSVVLDGQHKVGNGFDVFKANNVWIENLTAKNFEFGEGCAVESCGNAIWWNGGADSGRIGAHGWYGNYLTAYDTGLHGGYGIFTNNETEGEFENIYASGYADSGLYIGACQECQATVTNATMENNALGYSGSNSGGSLVVERSRFAHNTVGYATNSENPGDPPPPQDGECNRPEIPSTPTPTITSTRIKRCTVIRKNEFIDNNNLSVPTNGSTEVAPWGVGIEIPGDYADAVELNTISGNPNDGVLGFEYPNPFPLPPFCEPAGSCGTIDFQFSGNKINNNWFSDNGTNGGEFAGDIAMLSGAGEWLDENFGFEYGPAASVNNCLQANHLSDPIYPPNGERTWNCSNKTTPNPGGGEAGVFYLLGLINQADLTRSEKTPVGQPVPPPQPTMPKPCSGVPRNPLCK